MFLNMKTIEKYIEVFENSIESCLCDAIIKEYKNSDEWKKGTIGDYNIDTNIRNCDSIFISNQKSVNLNPKIRSDFDSEIFKVVSNCLKKYIDLHYTYLSNIESDSGYSLLRYKTGNFIGNHIDASNRCSRELSLSINLNDNYTGGEFSFFNKELKFKLKKGDVIVFPSNFMYPHEILPISSGERYSIITWIS